MIKSITKLRFVYIVALAAGPLLIHAMTLKSMEVQQELNPANQELLAAVRAGNLEATEAAIKAGADVNYADEHGNTALIAAPREEGADPNIVRFLIDRGANVNDVNIYGVTALGQAALWGHIEIARMLIEADADVNHANSDGNTPLILAAQDGCIAIVKMLIEAGANINHANSDDDTALVDAAWHRYADIVKLLIEHGSTLSNTANQEIQKAIHSSFGTNELAYEAARGNGERVLEIVIARPDMINNQDTQKMTALHWAAAQGRADIVAALLARGANFRLTNAEGLTPYHLAERNRNEMARAGDRIGAQRFQNTMDTITNVLTQFTAPRTLISAFGQMTGRAPAEVVQAIVAHNLPQVTIENPNTALLIAVADGNLNGVTRALAEGANVNYASFMGVTPLIVAARHGNFDVVKLLIERGAHINQAGRSGFAALSVAAGLNHTEIARFLLEHGSSTLLNVETLKKLVQAAGAGSKQATQSLKIIQRLRNNIRSIFGVDVLAYEAAIGDTPEVIKLLSTLPANSPLLSMRDARGMTPLHWAAATGNVAVIDALLEHGADWGIENAEGLTPVRLAERNRDEMAHAGDTEGAQRMQAVIDAITHYLQRRVAKRKAQESSAQPPTRKRRTEKLIQGVRLGTPPQRPPLGGGTSNP